MLRMIEKIRQLLTYSWGGINKGVVHGDIYEGDVVEKHIRRTSARMR